MALYIILGLCAIGAFAFAAAGKGSMNRFDLSDNQEVRDALAEERRLTRRARNKSGSRQREDDSDEPGRKADPAPGDRALPRQDLPNYPRHVPK